MLAEARPRGGRGRVEGVLGMSQVTRKIAAPGTSKELLMLHYVRRVTPPRADLGVGCEQMEGNDVLKNPAHHPGDVYGTSNMVPGIYWL